MSDFFSKIGNTFKSIFSFFSKNTATLTEAAVIAETVSGNAELIPTTIAVGKAVEQGQSCNHALLIRRTTWTDTRTTADE